MKKYPENVLISGRVRVCLELVTEARIADKVVVDMGSSFGWLEKEIVKMKPKKLIGVEMDEEAVKFSQKSVKDATFLVGNALDFPLTRESADVVILFDVIEHVPVGTEMKVFKEINRVLKKGGKLLFSTPNKSLFSNLFDIAWYFGHRHYEKRQTIKMLESKGFVIEKIETKGNILSSLYLTWFYIAKRVLNTSQPRSNFFESLDDLGYKGVGITDIFLIARKN